MTKWLLWLAGLATASITVQVSNVEPLPLRNEGIAVSAVDLFRRSCPEEVADEKPYVTSLLASSFDDEAFTRGSVFPSSDGFVRGAVDAWAQHQHLVLRPDEVWFEILAQMNFYMGAHVEDLRGLFVDHGGREKIVVEGFSWEEVVEAVGGEVQKRVKTGWLLDWIMPGFSTSTERDGVTATVLMMGLMQHFFEFEGMLVCGIPSVTLLGERGDWVKLLGKLDRLEEFGDEPKRFANKLRPILKRFVRTWDEPGSEEIKAFWEQIVRAKKKWSCGEGAVEWEVSGWVTGFMHFDRMGRVRGVAEVYDDDDDEEEMAEEKGSNEEAPEMGIFPNDWSVTIDGVGYIPESLEDIAIGYAKAPLKMVNYPIPGVDTQAYLLAGNIGIEREDIEGRITAQPVSGWFIYAPVDSNHTTGPDFGSGVELEDIAVGIKTCKGTKEKEDEVKDL
ncbi:hypothetical protein FSARC_9434 [Fusarium sarcochroum]|uniref:Uncharacterized protein n=1 Tax=Fusarium sarcochroum TaxID=1208366 RepID=A0A8H4TQX5_9HYPO|nr:hypothetical protein FSARC_9434 [Fusarium sarcochroum]